MVPISSKRAATKSSSSTKSKSVVKVLRNPKKHPPPGSKVVRKKPRPPPELPNEWPVASRLPEYGDDALAPGLLLKQNCNGQDIHLARNAVQKPNLVKEKGKFLLILPGNLSLKSFTESSKASQLSQVSLSQNSVGLGQTSIGLSQEMNESVPSSQPLFTLKKVLPTLGRLTNLSTDQPKLVLKFSSTKSLVFPGKKVSTSSKYMMLSCSSKRKGHVACKCIFSSAIVFGQPTWQITKEETDTIEFSSLLQEDDQDTGELLPKEDTPKSFNHYGGSQRTTDGVGKGKKTSQQQQKEESSKMLVPIYSSHKKPLSLAAKLPDLQKLDQISEEEHDDDEYQFAGLNSTSTNLPRRASSQRKTVTQRQKYTQDSGSRSSSEISDSDEDEDKRTGKVKERRARTGKITVSNTKKQTQVGESSEDDSEDVSKGLGSTTKKERKSAPNQSIEVDDTDEDDDIYSGEEIPVSLARSRPPSRRSSSTSNKPKYTESNSDEENGETSDDEEPQPPAKRGRATPKIIKRKEKKAATKRRATRKGTVVSKQRKSTAAAFRGTKKIDPIVVDINDDDADSHSNEGGDVASLKRNLITNATKKAAATTKKSNEKKTQSNKRERSNTKAKKTVVSKQDKTDIQTEGRSNKVKRMDVLVNLVSSPKSPFRSRRRKSSTPNKTKKSPRTLSMDDDDDFDFGG